MPDELRFVVPGIPRARQAHQFYRLKNRSGAVAVLPKESVEYQTRVALSAQQAMEGAEPFGGILYIDLLFIFPAPGSLRKHLRERVKAGESIPYPHIPQDVDNLAKNALDGLKGVAIEDDRLVCDLQVQKRIGANPCTIVTIRRAEP